MVLHLLFYDTYEDYLDAFIVADDFKYLRNWKLSRNYVQHACGKNCMGTLLSQEEFHRRRKVLLDESAPRAILDSDLFCKYFVGHDNVLRQLAKRERALMIKQISTIVFLLMRNKSGMEVSSFIDVEQSMRESRQKTSENHIDWRAIFEGKSKLMPKRHHLSYCDSNRNVIIYNDSDNYRLIAEGAHSLLMMHRGDHNIICVNGGCYCKYASNAVRSMYTSRIYGHAIFFDHLIRRIN